MEKLPVLLTFDNQTCADPGKRSYKSDYFVDEFMIVEILKRMPPKSVGRMRCVCKSWNSLISSRFFIIRHHHHHLRHPKSYLWLERSGVVDPSTSSDNPARGSPSYAFYYPDQGIPFDRSTVIDSLSFEPSPFLARQKKPLRFFDVIHGVVCLTSKSPRSAEDPSDSNTDTLLWNPSLHTYVKVPNSPFQFDGAYDHTQYASSLGFGFSRYKNCFMLMRLWVPVQSQSSLARNKPQKLLYEVFSPQDGVSVKAVGACIRPGKVISKSSLFMNGTVHWILSTKLEKSNPPRTTEYYRLLRFDCERQKFTTMKLPKRCTNWVFDPVVAILFKFQGMLAVMIPTYSSIEMWVMQKYGVAKSWKRRVCGEGWSELYGLISHESMFLADAKCPTFSYVKKQDSGNGKVYYEMDGTACDHILI